ncbi:MAG: TerC family protein [Alphaproteobacteria bacterium]|nr:TerC family protein [Alphaproteobacteria bacterium]
MDIANLVSWSEVSALFQVIMIDLVLAGDNAIVVGMVASGLPREQRTKVIMIGIVAATLMRICFALVTTQLLEIIGLTLAGGILLLWVCWKLWQEIQRERKRNKNNEETESVTPSHKQANNLRQAIINIVLADISMSLDNVLAVAGAAREHGWVLIIGLTLSVAFMGMSASLIANLLKKYHWLSYLGLIIVLYVACKMIWDGSKQVFINFL